MVPVLEAFEGGSSGVRNENALPPIPPFPAAMQEEDGEDDAGSDRHSLEDGQITQDERGNYRWIGSSNTISLLDSFSNQPLQTPLSSTPHTHTPDRNPYFGPVAGSGVVKALPGVDEVSYPTHRAAREMVDAFFSDVHPTLPVVLEYEFRQEFDALMDRRSRGEVETSSQTVSSNHLLSLMPVRLGLVCGFRSGREGGRHEQSLAESENDQFRRRTTGRSRSGGDLV